MIAGPIKNEASVRRSDPTRRRLLIRTKIGALFLIEAGLQISNLYQLLTRLQQPDRLDETRFEDSLEFGI